MGKRNRERVARIEAGTEQPIAARRVAMNPVGRAILKRTARGGVIEQLSAGSTADQVDRLSQLTTTGALPGGKLKSAIVRKAPKEMDKGIKKMQKEGKEVSVDSLCAEVKSTPGFLSMCEKVGLDLAYFENLAKERMEKHGL